MFEVPCRIRIIPLTHGCTNWFHYMAKRVWTAKHYNNICLNISFQNDGLYISAHFTMKAFYEGRILDPDCWNLLLFSHKSISVTLTTRFLNPNPTLMLDEEKVRLAVGLSFVQKVLMGMRLNSFKPNQRKNSSWWTSLCMDRVTVMLKMFSLEAFTSLKAKALRHPLAGTRVPTQTL